MPMEPKIIALPPLAALAALITANPGQAGAPWRLDSLAWLIALFVLTIGFIVQRYSWNLSIQDEQCAEQTKRKRREKYFQPK